MVLWFNDDLSIYNFININQAGDTKLFAGRIIRANFPKYPSDQHGEMLHRIYVKL